MLFIDFVAFVKVQILRFQSIENQNIENSVIFRNVFPKGMHSYVPNVGLYRNSSKKVRLNENRIPLAFEETSSTRGSYPVSKCPVHTNSCSIRSNEAHVQKPHGDSFFLSFFAFTFLL